jgi:3-oxoadipate enol-lactonase
MSHSSGAHVISVNGILVHYSLEGPPDVPTLMFGNGLATSTEMWDEQARYFSQHWQVLRYDTRGHGSTGASEPPYSAEQLAHDVVGLLDRLGIGRAHYVGLSLGGMIGQYVVARHSDRFASLTLCDTTMRMNRQMWDARIAAIEAEGIEPQVHPSIDRWFTPSFSAAHSEIVEQLRHMIRTTSKQGYLGCAMAIRDMELEPLTRTIVVPTLVLVGRDDRSTPVEDASELHAAIRGSELAVLDHAAHLPNIEQTRRFNEVLQRFLNTHRRVRSR